MKTTSKLFRIERVSSHDQRGFRFRVRGRICLALTFWSIWHYQRRNSFGFLLTAALPAPRAARGSAIWTAKPLWLRALWMPNALRRNFWVGRNTRGGSGCSYKSRGVRAGYASITPYSFR